MAKVDEAVEWARGRVSSALERLGEYVAIPALSRDPERYGDVRRMAEVAAADLRAAGVEGVELLELEGVLPCVKGERFVSEGAPTVLIYGHFDQQPVEEDKWETPPHVMTERGERLYGRGVADDLGGWLSQLIAFEAWQQVGGAPVNVKFLLEGEEEIGSPRLVEFMEAYPEAFDADVMILTDCDNPSTEVAGLTTSLRGLLELKVTLRGLRGKVHSGLWGGALPDPAVGLCKLIGALVDDAGRVVGLDVAQPEGWRESVAGLSPDDAALREAAGLLEGVPGLDPGERPRVEWMWRQPHLTVVGTTLPNLDKTANVIQPEASAVLSIRLAPGQSPDEVEQALRARIEAQAPFGLQVEVERLLGGAGWSYAAEGPAFDAAGRAYKAAFGAELVKIGVGGSIPFIALFAERFPDTPLILNGVMDPQTNAHGPNESLHKGLFAKVVEANVRLLGELAEIPRG